MSAMGPYRQLRAVLSLFFVGLCYFIGSVRGDPGDSNNHFINPPPQGAMGVYTNDARWPIGSTQIVAWTSNFSFGELYVFQDLNDDPVLLLAWQMPIASYVWNVSSNANWKSQPAYYFSMVQVGAPVGFAGGFASTYVNLTTPVASSTFSTITATSSSSTSSMISPNSTRVSVSSSSALPSTPSVSPRVSGQSGSTASSTDSSVSSQTNAIAIGVGAGVGGAALVAFMVGAICLGHRWWKKRLGETQGEQAGKQPVRDTPVSEIGTFGSRWPYPPPYDPGDEVVRGELPANCELEPPSELEG